MLKKLIALFATLIFSTSAQADWEYHITFKEQKVQKETFYLVSINSYYSGGKGISIVRYNKKDVGKVKYQEKVILPRYIKSVAQEKKYDDGLVFYFKNEMIYEASESLLKGNTYSGEMYAGNRIHLRLIKPKSKTSFIWGYYIFHSDGNKFIRYEQVKKAMNVKEVLEYICSKAIEEVK